MGGNKVEGAGGGDSLKRGTLGERSGLGWDLIDEMKGRI